MIDRQPRHVHSHTSGARHPGPTTVSYGTGLTERRGRRSGLIDAKPCTRCAAAVTLDSRRIHLSDGQAVIACLSCGTLVACRRADLYRTPPDATADERRASERRGRWRRKAAPGTPTDPAPRAR